MNILLTITYLISTTAGMTLMKLGGDSLSLSLKKGISFNMEYLTFCGFLLYIISFLLWQKLLVAYNLSYIVPLTTGIAQILVLLIGYFIFKESFSIINVIGIVLIIIGVILVSNK